MNRQEKLLREYLHEKQSFDRILEVNRQEKILKRYIKEVVSSDEDLNEAIVGSAKKAASGIVSSVKGIFKGGSKGQTWAEKQFALFKQEAGDKIAKKAGGILNRLFDKVIPESWLNIIPEAWTNLLKQSIAALYVEIPEGGTKPYMANADEEERGDLASRIIKEFESKIFRLTASRTKISNKEDITRKAVESSIKEEEVQSIIKGLIDSRRRYVKSNWGEDSRGGGSMPSNRDFGELDQKWGKTLLEVYSQLKIDSKYLHPDIVSSDTETKKISNWIVNSMKNMTLKIFNLKNEKKEPYASHADNDDVIDIAKKISEAFQQKSPSFLGAVDLNQDKEKVEKDFKEAVIKTLKEVAESKEIMDELKSWEENVKEEG